MSKSKTMLKFSKEMKEEFLKDVRIMSLRDLALKYHRSMTTIESRVKSWTNMTFGEYKKTCGSHISQTRYSDSPSKPISVVLASYTAKTEAAKKHREQRRFVRQAETKERRRTRIIPAAEKPRGYIW